MDYVTGLSLVMVILIEDVLLCNVQSVMQCFEGFEFTAANLCLEVKKFEDCVAPLADKCKDNAVYNTYVNQLKIFKPSCGGSSGAVCDVMGLQKCMAEVEYAEGVDLRDNCARFEECTQPLIAQCGDNDPQYMNIKSSIDSFRHVCASSDLSSAQCDLQAAMNCLTGFELAQSAESTNTAATCSSYLKAMTCLAPIKENCNSDENFKSSFAMLTSVESMCAGGAECTGSLQKCYVDAGIDTTGGSMPEPTCEDAKTLQTCVKGLSTVCEGNYAYDQSKTSLQDVVAKCTSAGTQAFPSFVLILVAALMTFAKAF